MKKYYYAKIGQGNSQAERYLRGENEINKPAIPIYFNCEPGNKEDFLRNGGSNEQGKNFFECGESNKDKHIIVIHNGLVRFLEPIGDVEFKKSELPEKIGQYVKLLPIKEVKQLSITDVPAILASIAANRYYSSGTFRRIENLGNIIAIQVLLGQEIEVPSKSSINAITCLSSFEFETLIAKIFEEAECFVPAYRGGNMQGADLFAYNKTASTINMGRLSINPNKGISIQVKLTSKLKEPPHGVDFLIVGTEIPESDNCLGYEWLVNVLARSNKTLRWLRQSLEWLPADYLNATIKCALH